MSLVHDDDQPVVDQTTTPETRGRRPARAAAVTLVVVLLLLTLALGYVDGTGLFTPENWVDAGVLPTWATSPAWATVAFLPLLVVGSGLLAYRVVASLSSRTSTWWAWWAAWSSVVVVAPLAKLAYTCLLLLVAGFDALSPVSTVRAVLAEVGLAAAKYAFLAVPAALVAAVAYRVVRGRVPSQPNGGGGEEKARPLWSWAWFLVGAALATWATLSTSAWVEGAWRVAVLTVVGFAGAYGMSRLVWWRLRRRVVGRGLWVLAATSVAASALGFVLPWLVDALLNGPGGGLFPVVGVLVHVGIGALAGLVTCAGGLVGDLVTRSALGDRAGLTRRAGWGRIVGAVLAVLVAAAVVVAPAQAGAAESYTVPTTPSADAGGLLALKVDRDGSPIIADAANRQVLLRGVNVNQLVDYGQRDPSSPTVRPLTMADYREMASVYGFDVQRLNLSWSALEPSRGDFDENYVARVRKAVDQAASQGIYTVLDMHQDTYSKYVTAKPGTKCRLGAEPEFGNDGAPQWATLGDGFPGCGFQGRDLSPNVEQSFTNLYANRDGIGTAFAEAWGVLAHEFASDTAVAGYDLLNEPGPGNAPGVTSSILLGRLYEQSIQAIRAAESDVPGGYSHLVFFEPSILWSGLGFDATPPVGFTSDPALVFSPHLYSESITMDQGLGITLTTIEHGYETAARAADAYDVPLWSGEWGWFGDIESVGSRYFRFLDQQNERMLGSAVWVWKKACGDPQTSEGDDVAGGLKRISCPDGRPIASPAFETTALSQAYPRASPGRLTSLASSPTKRDLRLAGSGDGELDVWLPGVSRPTVHSTGLAAVRLERTGQGWRLSAQASGDYTLSAQ